MTSISTLEVGHRVGVIHSNRRGQWCHEGVVTKITDKQIVVRHDNATAVTRYDRSSGYAIGKHEHGQLSTLDNARYLEVKAQHEASIARATAERNEAEAAREARFGISAIAEGNEKLSRMLHEIARSIIDLENELQRRIERTTPRNLYRELSWLEGATVKSAELDWLLSLFDALRSESPKIETIKVCRDAARNQLLQPYSSINQTEERAKLLAAREVYERLNSHLQYTLEVND